MHNSSGTREGIAQEAADWFCRLQRIACGADERVAFSEWLICSPLHLEEFLAVSAAWALIDVPVIERFTASALVDAARDDHGSADVLEFPQPALQSFATSAPSGAHWTFPRRWRAAAAALVLTIAAGLSYRAWHPATEFATAIGEQRSIGLADGSVVFLNTNSDVRIRWTKAERRIELRRGEARFQVAKNAARPFMVETSEATVRAVGTIFNVMAEASVTRVTVIEGRVNVRAHHDEPASIELSAGENAAVNSRGRIDPSSGPPVESVDAWTVRHLVFRDETLDKVVAEFNRYHDVPMVVDDTRLAALKINGVFDSNDPETLVAFLKTFEAVQTRVATDGTLHLSISPSVTKPER